MVTVPGNRESVQALASWNYHCNILWWTSLMWVNKCSLCPKSFEQWLQLKSLFIKWTVSIGLFMFHFSLSNFTWQSYSLQEKSLFFRWPEVIRSSTFLLPKFFWHLFTSLSVTTDPSSIVVQLSRFGGPPAWGWKSWFFIVYITQRPLTISANPTTFPTPLCTL